MDIAQRQGNLPRTEGLRSADKRFVGDCIRGMAQSGSTEPWPGQRAWARTR